MATYNALPAQSSEPESTLGRIGSTLRSLAHLSPRQVVAQLAHAFRGPAHQPERTRIEGVTLALPPTFAGLAPEGTVDASGAVSVCGVAPFDPVAADWNLVGNPLWLATMNQHGWLTRLAPERAATTIRSWIDHHPRGIGWEPYPTSMRLLSWLGFLVSAGGRLPAESTQGFAQSMAAQCEHLLHNLETHRDDNHLWSNLAAVAATSMSLAGPGLPDPAQAAGRFVECVVEQLSEDGVHLERTPTLHCMLTEQLACVTDLAWARQLPQTEALQGHLRRMYRALPSFTHPDGDVALWGDSRRGLGANPATLYRRAGLKLPLRGHADTPTSGFARRTWGRWTLLLNRGDVGAPHHARHLHGDASAFELSLLDERVVVDAGVGTFAPGHDRAYARATCAHNTVTIGEGHPDQHELRDGDRIGGRAEVIQHAWTPDSLEFEVLPHGARARHRRTIVGDENGIRITDLVSPSTVAVSRIFVPATLRLHSHGNGLSLVTPRGQSFTIAASTGGLRVEPAAGWLAPGVPAPRLCLATRIPAEGVTIEIRGG